MDPQDPAVRDIIYQYNPSNDPGRFQDEFARRKKLADKGIIEKDTALSAGSDSNSGGNGGWSEVAKKGSNHQPKEEPSVPGFRVVPSKKNKNGKK